MNTIKPYISICIPAYKNADFLKRLLDSLENQTYKDYEIIVTDDSDDSSVENLIKTYQIRLPIHYRHNRPACGSPANWNAAIRLAKGEWIKIMHDDDWFASIDSLSDFHKATKETQSDFIFSAFNKVKIDKDEQSRHVLSRFQVWMLNKFPYILYQHNYIGHPSTTLIRNNRTVWFDENTRWVVDFEFYLRSIEQSSPIYFIQKPLVNIGISDEQITAGSFRNKNVEIPEYLYLLNKHGNHLLKKIFVFDQFWRLMRNFNIIQLDELVPHAKGERLSPAFEAMIRFQKRIGPSLLRKGVLSKCLMLTCYLYCRIGNHIR